MNTTSIMANETAAGDYMTAQTRTEDPRLDDALE
jgi:hypothetical protein